MNRPYTPCLFVCEARTEASFVCLHNLDTAPPVVLFSPRIVRKQDFRLHRSQETSDSVKRKSWEVEAMFNA